MNKYIFCIILTLFFLPSFGQYSFNKEKDKYWIYRECLKNFMVTGNCKGCDIPSQKRDKASPPKIETLSWADSPWMIGYWMGTLAMEYKLLIQSGLSSNSPEVMKTKQDLYRAIESVNRLDYEAEVSWGCSPCGYSPCLQNINGFLLNDDVPCDFSQLQHIIDGLNDGLVPPPDHFRVKCISSAYTEYETPGREASKDHLVGLYIGLTLVRKYLPLSENWNYTQFTNGINEPATSSFLTEVQIISSRIISNLSSNSFIYRNPCANRCVIGIHNTVNTNACASPNAQDPCSYLGFPQCCESGGAIVQPEAIGFAAVDQYIHGASTPTFIVVATNPYYQLLWNQSLNLKSYFSYTLAALSNTWKLGICIVNKEITFCDGLCWPQVWKCCHWKTITIPVPAVCNYTTAQISDFLVYIGKEKYWEHMYLTHKILHGGGNETISNSHYECLLNAAPCRGYDGAGQNVEWSGIDRFKGDRGTNYNTSFPRIDFMYFFNAYNIHNPQGSYVPTSANKLAPVNVLKENYTEYDKKNFIAAQTIEAKNYIITTSQQQEQGRVTFAAGQKIILSNGFKVVNGGYFHGYIDPSISAMNCSDPPSNTDCSSNLQRIAGNWMDFINEPDSVILLLNDSSIIQTEDDNWENNMSTINNIHIYPNPSFGIFTIESTQKIDIQQIEVYDMLGKKIQALLTQNGNTISLNLTGQSKGMYFIKMGKYNQKLIVE